MKKAITTMTILCLLTAGGIFSLTHAQDDKGRVGALMVAVPNVVGKTLTEALGILGKAGLRPQTQQSDRDGERRVVIRQDPAAGARVSKGTVVSIFGQLAGATDDKGRVNLPRR